MNVHNSRELPRPWRPSQRIPTASEPSVLLFPRNLRPCRVLVGAKYYTRAILSRSRRRKTTSRSSDFSAPSLPNDLHAVPLRQMFSHVKSVPRRTRRSFSVIANVPGLTASDQFGAELLTKRGTGSRRYHQ